MRDCANVEVRDLLPDLLHDRLGAAEREHVRAHVSGCDDCSAELSLLRASIAVAATDAPRVDAALLARQVLGRLHAAADVRPLAPEIARDARRITLAPRRARWGGGALRAAAAVVVLVSGAAALVLGRSGQRSPVVVSPPVAVAPVPEAVDSPTTELAAAPAAVAESVPEQPVTPARSTAQVAQSALGASFGDLTDDELAAVLEAVDAKDRGPAADPAPTPAIVTSGDLL
jgi:hypothetical protein